MAIQKKRSEDVGTISFYPVERAPDKRWLIIWAGTLGLIVSLGGIVELRLRQRGLQPTVNDSFDLWSYHRSRVYKNDGKVLVLIGASRIHGGFSLRVFGDRFPDYRVIQLSEAGAGNAFDILNDLAEDEQFKGIVICSLRADNFEPEYYRSRYKELLDHYYCFFQKDASLSARTETYLSRVLQEKMCFFHPRLKKRDLLPILLGIKDLPNLSRMRMTVEREGVIDGAIPNYAEWCQQKEQELRERQRELPTLSVEAWLREAEKIDVLVRKIQSRGGQVVFVRYPSSGFYYHNYDKIRYPRNEYWNRLSDASSAKLIHFEDYSKLSDVRLPDWCHLDPRDIPSFTDGLLDALAEQEVLSSKNIHDSHSIERLAQELDSGGKMLR